MKKPPFTALPEPRPRWHRLYYLLAIFDICALCVSLYLNHRIMQIYTDSVDTNRMWVEIWRKASDLGELSAAIDAPGNDVFQSEDVAGESARMEKAYADFNFLISDLRTNLAALPDTDRIDSMLEDLKTARSSTAQMVRDAKLTFAFFEARQLSQAVKHMASMDRRYATVNSTFVRLRSRIGTWQNDQFDTQTAAAASLQKSEYLIAGMITLMILGATAYGRVIALQASLAVQRREAYRQELEERVAERTFDLATANHARAELLKQLISAQEEERRRIARDLHDGIGQALTYLARGLESASNEVAGQPRLQQLREVAVQTLDEARRIARGLRPSVLDDLGLRPALDRLVSDFQVTHDFQVQLYDEMPSHERLPDVIETALYRIVQESLTNIARHSRASHVGIRLVRCGDRVEATVSDNGQGFEQRVATGPGTAIKASLGLSSIRERAAILGGSAEIKSVPGIGTEVLIRIPLPNNSDVARLQSDEALNATGFGAAPGSDD